VSIGSDENAVELMEKLSKLGAELLSETLVNLMTLTPVEQVESQATYAPILKKEDGLIDWRLSARQIANRIRGFQPFPTAFTHFQKLRLTLWRGSVCFVENRREFVSGEVLEVNGKLVIGCGNTSALSVDELQLEGKRRLTTRDFLNGVKLQIGEILGDPAVHGE